jgi:hypothetical protein
MATEKNEAIVWVRGVIKLLNLQGPSTGVPSIKPYVPATGLFPWPPETVTAYAKSVPWIASLEAPRIPLARTARGRGWPSSGVLVRRLRARGVKSCSRSEASTDSRECPIPGLSSINDIQFRDQ